jgi:hypothetical protein
VSIEKVRTRSSRFVETALARQEYALVLVNGAVSNCFFERVSKIHVSEEMSYHDALQ